MTQLFNTNNFTEGVFTIIHAKARQDRYGRPYHHFELAQGNAQLDAYDWSASCHIEHFPKELEVLASGIMRKFNKELVLDLTRLTPARLTCQWPIILTPFWPIKLTHPGREKVSSRVCASVDSSLLPA